MSIATTKTLKITERDKAILEYVGTVGYVSKKELRAIFFSQYSEQWFKDCIAKLTRANYLHTKISDDRGKTERIYWINRKASMLFDKSKRDSFIKGSPNSSEIGHLLDSAEALRIIRSKYQIANYRNEHQLRSIWHNQRKPERGDFSLDLEGRNVIFEMDAPSYVGERLIRKIRSLGQIGKPVYWIVKTYKRYQTVSEASSNYANIIPVMMDEMILL